MEAGGGVLVAVDRGDAEAAAFFGVLMGVVVAIETEEFPVAAVGRVVHVVVVFVMDREFAEALSGEFAAASRADVREESERLRAVSLFALGLFAPG
jgi:hypothetical protein